MLVRFVASNFLSLKEEVEFNMLTGEFNTHQHHVYQAGGIDVLKGAAIYGANGAGKSNLIKAVSYLKHLATEGAITTPVNSKKFKLDPIYQKRPVRFEIEFFTNRKLYSYGIVIDHTVVLEEWLYESGVTEKDRLIFERTTDSESKPNLILAKEYRETQKQQLLIELLQENLLKRNQLLLGKYEETKIGEISVVRDWIGSKITIIYPDVSLFTEDILHQFVNDKYLNPFTNYFLLASDTGVDRFRTTKVDITDLTDINETLRDKIIESLNNEPFVVRYVGNKEVVFMREGNRNIALKITTVHRGSKDSSVEFELDEESDGTRRILNYIPPIFLCATVGHTVLIDEIDRSIHPTLVKSLVKNVMSKQDIQGQLIFTTHESNLLDLDIFRQDEIWFAEKERPTGATRLYSLSEFKPGYESDIKKGYLNGRFGAIPFLADLENLNWHRHAEKE